MKIVKCLTHAAVVLACCGMMVPNAAFAAPTSAKPSNDIALSADGTFSAVLVTTEGQPVDGAKVVVRQGGQEIAQGVTNKQGAVEIKGLSTGMYDLVLGGLTLPVRTWSPNIAPPTARSQAVVVVGTGTRGQSCLGGLDIVTIWLLTASTGALILSAINQSDLNDIKDKLKSP